MNIKVYILLVTFFLISRNCFAQLNAEQFKKFEALTKEDELIINVNNYGCRVQYYYRYIFYINSKGYMLKQFSVFPYTYVDGEKLSIEKLIKLDEEQRNFKLETLTKVQFLNLIEELRQIVSSNNASENKFAGDGVRLEIDFNGQSFSKEFTGWIEFKCISQFEKN